MNPMRQLTRQLPPLPSRPRRFFVTALLIPALLVVTPAFAERATSTELYQRSFSLETNGDYAEALARMDDLAAQGEDTYLLHLRRGWLLYLLGRYGDSVTSYDSALGKEPGSAEALAGRTLPLMAQSRWAEAERSARRLLSLAPGNYLGMSRLAWVLYSSGRYAEAETAYRSVLEQYPSDNDMRAGLGWALLKQGKSGDARAAFARVLAVVPSHVSASQGMATL